MACQQIRHRKGKKDPRYNVDSGSLRKRDRPRKGMKDPRYWDAAGNPKKRSLEDTKWGDNSGVLGTTR